MEMIRKDDERFDREGPPPAGIGEHRPQVVHVIRRQLAPSLEQGRREEEGAAGYAGSDVSGHGASLPREAGCAIAFPPYSLRLSLRFPCILLLPPGGFERPGLFLAPGWIQAVHRIGDIVLPKFRLQLLAPYLECALRFALLQESAVGIQRLRCALLESDPSAVLPVERLVDLPLEDEGRGCLPPGFSRRLVDVLLACLDAFLGRVLLDQLADDDVP